MESDRDGIPYKFKCPITGEIMREPVLAEDGFIYEKVAIRRWLRKHYTSPMCRVGMPDGAIVSCPKLKEEIEEWLQKNHPKQTQTKCIVGGIMELEAFAVEELHGGGIGDSIAFTMKSSRKATDLPLHVYTIISSHSSMGARRVKAIDVARDVVNIMAQYMLDKEDGITIASRGAGGVVSFANLDIDIVATRAEIVSFLQKVKSTENLFNGSLPDLELLTHASRLVQEHPEKHIPVVLLFTDAHGIVSRKRIKKHLPESIRKENPIVHTFVIADLGEAFPPKLESRVLTRKFDVTVMPSNLRHSIRILADFINNISCMCAYNISVQFPTEYQTNIPYVHRKYIPGVISRSGKKGLFLRKKWDKSMSCIAEDEIEVTIGFNSPYLDSRVKETVKVPIIRSEEWRDKAHRKMISQRTLYTMQMKLWSATMSVLAGDGRISKRELAVSSSELCEDELERIFEKRSVYENAYTKTSHRIYNEAMLHLESRTLILYMLETMHSHICDATCTCSFCEAEMSLPCDISGEKERMLMNFAQKISGMGNKIEYIHTYFPMSFAGKSLLLARRANNSDGRAESAK